MVSCGNVAVYWTRCVISEFSAWSVAVVATLTVAAKYSVHSFLMWSCSPHLKHVGQFLLFDEFGESLNKPLQSAVLVVWVGKICCAAVSLLVFLHGSLRPVVVVVPPVKYVMGSVLSPWIIESLTGGFVLIGTTGWFGCAVVLLYGVWIEVCGSLWRLLFIFCCTGVLYWDAGIQAEEVVLACFLAAS